MGLQTAQQACSATSPLVGVSSDLPATFVLQQHRPDNNTIASCMLMKAFWHSWLRLWDDMHNALSVAYIQTATLSLTVLPKPNHHSHLVPTQYWCHVEEVTVIVSYGVHTVPSCTLANESKPGQLYKPELPRFDGSTCSMQGYRQGNLMYRDIKVRFISLIGRDRYQTDGRSE